MIRKNATEDEVQTAMAHLEDARESMCVALMGRSPFLARDTDRLVRCMEKVDSAIAECCDWFADRGCLL